MSSYVPSTEQLVSEIVCRDVQRSAAFYRQLGFDLPPIPQFPAAYLRIRVSNVDDYWRRVNVMGARILVPIADCYYGSPLSLFFVIL